MWQWFARERKDVVNVVVNMNRENVKRVQNWDVVTAQGNIAHRIEDVRLAKGRQKYKESKLFKELVMQKQQRRFQKF